MLPILAVIVGVAASAFTVSTKTNNLSGKDPSFYWFNTSKAYQDLNTTVGEQNATGCDGTVTLCENGYTSNQLIDPSDPSLGVKSGQTPASRIYIHQ